MNRRTFVATAAGFTLSSCRRASRPNILFVIADDMSYPHASAYGDKVVSTPAFDRVALEGALFTNSFCASPSCTPSRSAVLTGRPIWSVGEAGVLYGTMPAKYALFPHVLEDDGYFTGYTGKGWGPGDWKAAGLQRNPTGREFNSRRHAQPVADGIDVRDYAANFEDFLNARPQNRPFCFWLGATEPHRVYAKGAGLKAGKKLDAVRVPPFLPDTEEIRSDLLDYYQEIEWMDTQLARALKVLEKTGQLDDTIVVVTSDNGMPFPRAKVNLYDGGVHMPLAIRWGRRITAGTRVNAMVSHTSFAATLLEAADVERPESILGPSIWPLLKNPDADSVDRIFTGMERHTMCRPDGATYPMRAIRTKTHLYVRNFEPDRWPTGGPDFISSNKTYHGDVDGCPTKDFMLQPANQQKFAREHELCFGKRPTDELFDVRDDPWQVKNLATDPRYASMKASMLDSLTGHLKSTGDPRMEYRDPWKDYPYRQTTGFGASFNKALSPEERKGALDRATHKPE